MRGARMRLRVNLSVTTEDLNLAARVAERFAATAVGVADDGAEAFVMIGPDDEDGEL